MTDDAVFRLAWTVAPHTGNHPTPDMTSPVQRIAAARRDPDGVVTIWPTCSRGGDTTALSRVIDPIDPLDPEDDTFRLLADTRTREHNAHVLAYTVLGMS